MHPSNPQPTIVKLGTLWAAVLGGKVNGNLEGDSSKILFKSLERKNVEDFIRYSWNGINPITQE